MTTPGLAEDRLSRQELRAGASLALVFGLRMLGLFLVLPVFSLYVRELPGGESLLWAGVALGAFALTQSLLQIPCGMASDRFGRKRVIVLGLLVYCLGSLMAAWAPTIEWMVAARALQGGGAISAAISALAADLTREQHRTKIMAMIGASIGLVFAGSLVAAPSLYAAIGMPGMFLSIAGLGGLAILLVLYGVPDPEDSVHPAEALPWRTVLADAQLWRLNFGVFVLHLVQIAMFLVVPRMLVDQHAMLAAAHWKLYLPVVLASFVVMVPAIVHAERRSRLKPVFLVSVALVGGSQLMLAGAFREWWVMVLAMLVFFASFNVLEASMPALVSRIAPAGARGLALGSFNTSQALGAAAGGIAGGALASHAGNEAVFLGGALMVAVWWLCAYSMRVPPVSALRSYALPENVDIEEASARIARLPGVREVTVEPVRRVAHLKINPERWDEPRMLRLIGGEA